MPFSFSVPAFLSPRARSAFSAGPRPVGRRSSAAAVLASIVAIAAASLTAPASASMIVTVEDTAEGLKFSYSGSLNITASTIWSQSNTTAISGGGSDTFSSVTTNAQYVGFTGTTSASPDGFFTFSGSHSTAKPLNSGDIFGVRTGSLGKLVILPNGYAGGTTPISGYGIISGETIASTGFYDQVITITSGSAAGETITLQATAVPEPSTWALGALALACGGWQLTRRRRALRLKA